MKKTLLYLLISSGVLAGCEVGPDYRRPDDIAASHFAELNTTPATQPTTQPATLASMATLGEEPWVKWWTHFNDPALDGLIDRAIEENLDLKLAASRVREARQLRTIAASRWYPQIDIGGNYTRTTTDGAVEDVPGKESDFWEAEVSAAWEIDVFGGIARSVESTEAGIDASVENQHFMRVGLIAEVAREYIDLRGSQRLLEITRQNLADQQKTLSLTEERYGNGLDTDLDVIRARALTTFTESSIPQVDQHIRQTIHLLGVLLGEDPTALSAELTGAAPVPPVPPEVPVGLPSELLRRRPDVRRAERLLASQNAQIGVATADLFPKFNLGASAGFLTPYLDQLFRLNNPNNGFYLATPGVDWTIFDGGRRKSVVNVQNERTRQALLGYQQTALTALEETEDALAAYSREQVRPRSLQETVDSNQEAVRISSKLYAQGLIDFLSVLDAQTRLYEAQQGLTVSETAVSNNLVDLYKRLGGGWEDDSSSTSQTQGAK